MAEQDNNLDDLLDGEASAMDASQPEQEMAPQPEPELDAGPEPEPQQVETGEPNDVPPASERQDDGPLVPRKALEDERRKRQEKEQRLEQMEAWIAQQQQAMQPQPQAEQQPQVDLDELWFEDPKAAAHYIHQQAESTINQRLAQQSEMMEQRFFAQADQIARMKYEDYDETVEVFNKAIMSMPPQQGHALWDQMRTSPDPAAFAYQTAKQMQMMQDVGADPSAYEEKIRQKVLAELGMADGNAPPAQQSRQPPAQVPRSLAGKTNTRPRNSAGQFVEHASFEELLDE